MKKQALILTLILSLLLGGCGERSVMEFSDPTTESESIPTATGETQAATSGEAQTAATPGEYFTDRDFETEYDGGTLISLNGGSISCDGKGVEIDGTTVTITGNGTYILRGTLDDGMVIVSTENDKKAQLVLDGVTIHSESCAPIYVRQSDKVFITLADGTENSLSNGGSFTPIDENNIDAVIFSRDDLTLNGSGSLSISSPAGHGIVSKDELTVTGGTYSITTASHGLSSNDNVCIANADMTIAAGKDGIHSEHDEDAALGFVYIENGSFDITAEGDGISAGSTLDILDGTYTIVTGGGSENAAQQTSENWGGFGGGMGGMGGGMGGHGGMGGPGGGRRGNLGSDTAATETTETTETTEESTSIKALKSAGDMTVSGGDFTIDSADDSIHSNSNVTVSGGTFDIESGDDGFHADETLTITGGTIVIRESYEGLEGLHIAVSGGDIDLISTDDGLNAAGGTDSSGFGGMRGNDMFGGGMGGMGGASNGSILISGGKLHVNASGDGIDANGNLEISGGYTVVVGPTMGDTATLDYDTSAVISGGTFIGTGASGMAQTFSESAQGLLSLSVGNQSAGTEILLLDADGNTVLSYTPELDFAVVILSSPDMVTGETYTIQIGTATGDFSAS